MKPLKGRALSYQKTGQRNQQFCDSSFEGFLLFGVECWGVCGMLAAEAMWVSSTSKVGQLVPVPLLMCWRGALCGGLRARLKGLRSLQGGRGWIWPTKVGVRTSGPCESCTMSTDLWVVVQAQLPCGSLSQWEEKLAIHCKNTVSSNKSLSTNCRKADDGIRVFHKWLSKCGAFLTSYCT